MTTLSVRDVSLYVRIVGQGYPLLLMHGGPGLDHTSLLSFRRLADQFTLIFYDHRCNGRSNGVPVSSMTWENLTADADALRERMGFEKWAVLGHSFGGHVALEYALRYPDSLSHLILMDTGGDTWWSREHAVELLADRGFSPEIVAIARRFYHGQIMPGEMMPCAQKLAGAYYYHLNFLQLAHAIATGLRMKAWPDAFIQGVTRLGAGWNVMDRLADIAVPTLVLAGSYDFLFPPEHQAMLAAGIPNSCLEIIERAGHNAHDERTGKVMDVVRSFLVRREGALTGQNDTNGAYEAIDAYIERERRRLKIPGVSLAIVEGDQIVHRRGFGHARPHGEAPTPQTPFFAGSLNKSVIALAIMQLVEAGKVELDAPIQRYLPWFRVADAQVSAQMTVRHLLNQTSGLPTSAGELPLADFDDRPGAAESQARALASASVASAPGEVFAYSNANYSLLALVVAVASGQPFAAYVQERIFDPLAMRHTFTSADAARENGLAIGHRYWFGFPIAAPDLAVPFGTFRDSLIISSADDMARYLIAHLNGGRCGSAQILSPAGIDELHRGAATFGAAGLGPAERFFAKNITFGQYAMGWVVDQLGQTQVLSHGGTVPNYGAFIALLPEQKKGLVLLYNANHHWMLPVFSDFGMGASALLAGEPYKPMPGVRAIPWMLRAQLLIPALQLAGATATLWRLWRWRREPESRPQGVGAWRRHLVLPLIANLQVGQMLQPILGKRRGYLQLYMPDFALLATVCGSFSLLWGFLRSGLVGRALRRNEPPEDGLAT